MSKKMVDQRNPSIDPSVPSEDGVDRFTALPAELRNTIYDLVLPTGQTIAVRNKTSTEDGSGEMRSTPLKRLRWAEPGLLQVSKQIKRESRKIYYANNFFLIFAKPSEFGKACAFLLLKSNHTSVKIIINYAIRKINTPWTDVSEWQNLATLAYSTAVFSAEEIIAKILVPPSSKNQNSHSAMEELIHFAVKARDRKQEFEDFRKAVRSWAWERGGPTSQKPVAGLRMFMPTDPREPAYNSMLQAMMRRR